MRIKIIQTPTEVCIDGLRLDRFRVGVQYEVGHLLGALLLAERWAEPVTADEPAVATPLSDLDAKTPANLIKEIYPPYYEGPATSSDRRSFPRPRRT